MSMFSDHYRHLLQKIMTYGQEVEVGEWQSKDVRDKPEMISRELRHETVRVAIWNDVTAWQKEVNPNLPWAEDHFLERVSGLPLNPPPSEAWWPFRVRGNEDHKEIDGSKFSHTYPERFWPKYELSWHLDEDEQERWSRGRKGIRYDYGDLRDVVDQLVRNPLTRQAYLPIWFPEDTGAVQGQRVPCTLGYHFLCRNYELDIVYYMRSCDLLRHFADDVYMAGRLCQWVVNELTATGYPAIRPGNLVMHISSLHVFRGDYERINYMLAQNTDLEEDEGPVYGSAF